MADVSKIIRERAMAILRETRAKIDPGLLAAMKEHISASMPIPDVLKAPTPPSIGGEKKFVPPVLEEIIPPPTVSSAEAVDKQKIAQIVLNYMKHKENGSKH